MKPHAALLDPIRRPEVHAPGDGATVAAWHAGWAAAVGVTALVATGAMTGQVSGAASPVLLALAVMTGPGLAGLILLRRDTDEARSALMTLWMLAALSAAALSVR